MRPQPRLQHGELGVRGDDAQVGAERDLEAAAERGTVDRRDHGHLQLLPHPCDLLAEVRDAPIRVPDGAERAPALLRGGARRVAGHGLEAPEVESGAEATALTGQHDDAHGPVALQRFPRLGDGLEHRAVERVQLVRAVQSHVGDAVDDGERDAV